MPLTSSYNPAPVMTNIIRIGTRDSKLAVWQAEQVKDFLTDHNYQTELVFIKSEGDVNLTTPLYEVGVEGIFTKALDIALLENRIDVAVHSFKDVPTQLAKGLSVAAVLKRGNPFDVLVCRNADAQKAIQKGSQLIIATSSIRRKAQWLYRYPDTILENIRGNVQSRLFKLQSSAWHGTIFAAAGLERLGLSDSETGPQLLLDWMLPAPAQGAIVIVCKDEPGIKKICSVLNDDATLICTHIERDFLRLLQGGCSTPISALATIDEKEITLKGRVTSPDGSKNISILIKEKKENYSSIAQKAVDEIKLKGALELLKI